MRTIKKLTALTFGDFAPIMARAYPGLKATTLSDVERMKYRLVEQSEDPTINFYGMFQESQLIGGMRLNDFQMQFVSQKIKVGGLGSVAVDLLHKKEKVAKDLITYFIHHYQTRDVPILMLYAFRPDFYKKMGFGYGPKMNEYRVQPANLPTLPKETRIPKPQFVLPHDRDSLHDCYNRVMGQTHGLLSKSMYDLARPFKRSKNNILAYRDGGKIRGYIIFHFDTNRPDNMLFNNIHVSELIYETRDALAALLTFLHKQADQVNTIFFHTLDDTFHHLLHDPRNGTDNLHILYHETNTQGVGLMYRVIDVPALFRALAGHNFGGETCTLKITVTDSFNPVNQGSTLVSFKNGYATIIDQLAFDVEIKLDIAEFSSLVMGLISFKKLYMYRLADISDKAYLATVNRLFYIEQKPICTTIF